MISYSRKATECLVRRVGQKSIKLAKCPLSQNSSCLQCVSLCMASTWWWWGAEENALFTEKHQRNEMIGTKQDFTAKKLQLFRVLSSKGGKTASGIYLFCTGVCKSSTFLVSKQVFFLAYGSRLTFLGQG